MRKKKRLRAGQCLWFAGTVVTMGGYQRHVLEPAFVLGYSDGERSPSDPRAFYAVSPVIPFPVGGHMGFVSLAVLRKSKSYFNTYRQAKRAYDRLVATI